MSSEESKPRKQICSWCEEAEPTIYCSNCKAYYCKECDEDRHKKGKPKEHKRMAVTGTDWKGEKSVITRMCPVHSNNIIEAFCENEKKLLCFECAFEERGNGHKITKMEDVDPETIGDQNKTLAELKEVVEKGKELLKSLNDELTEIDKNKDEIVKKIEETVNALRKELDRIETQHKQKLEEEITTTKDLIIARSGELKETIESVEGFIKGVETNASSDDLYTKLWNISGLSSAKEKLNALETDKLENVRFSYTADIEAEKEKLKSLVDSFRSDKRVISLGTKSGFVPVSFDKLATTQNATAEIPTGQNTTHDGGAIFDAEKRVIVATSGNYDSGKSLKVTKLGSNPDDVRGETRLIANIIPFGTHGSYPVYDGTKWVYFFESESGSNNRFGRLDIDNLDARDFKELPRIPSGSFIEFSSAVHHFGNIYALGDSYKIWRFVVSKNRWEALSIQLPDKARLLSDGVREDVIYALVNGKPNFYEINLRTNSCTTRAGNSVNYALGANYEAYLLRTAPDDFIVFTSFTNTWYAYAYKANKWIKLSNWTNTVDSSAHFFFDPVTFHGFYHIHGRSKWEKVDMRGARM